MVTAWRLVKERFARSAFDGEGARWHGGRWNSPGTRMAYASESVALATLEVLVHLQVSAVLPSYALATIRFPEDLVEVLDPTLLPANWRQFPSPPGLHAIGDQWIKERRSAILQVPSAIIPSASNFLLNPAHPEFAQTVVEPPEPYEFDPRLVLP
jgi:RES domain-containing protein